MTAYGQAGWEVVEEMPRFQYVKLTRIRDGELKEMIFAEEGHWSAPSIDAV